MSDTPQRPFIKTAIASAILAAGCRNTAPHTYIADRPVQHTIESRWPDLHQRALYLQTLTAPEQAVIALCAKYQEADFATWVDKVPHADASLNPMQDIERAKNAFSTDDKRADFDSAMTYLRVATAKINTLAWRLESCDSLPAQDPAALRRKMEELHGLTVSVREGLSKLVNQPSSISL